ncbi:MAG: FAD:protein FMN transferase [Actinobacteria bacterium]|nr:FAD:protein FMN transferase [Actinomycetota bacterium]
MVASASWDAIGGWCEVLTVHEEDLPEVARLARERVDAVDQACSRFRPDSELSTLATGVPQQVSPLLAQLIGAALRTAEFTSGLVDPTVGAALRAQGYDADLADVHRRGAARPGRAAVPGWRTVSFDAETRTVTIPDGTELDLGASAKAWAADWIADTCAEELGAGCLINLGGDIAARGVMPVDGWQVEIDDGHAGPQGRPVISVVWPGGLATSSTITRTWHTTDGEAHHIIDPATGRPAARTWRTVTVAARRCERANAGSLAAIILGDSAPR